MQHSKSNSVQSKSFFEEWKAELKSPAYWLALVVLILSSATMIFRTNGHSSINVFGWSISFMQTFVLIALLSMLALYFSWPKFMAQWRGEKTD
jgi:hypothetical protein